MVRGKITGVRPGPAGSLHRQSDRHRHAGNQVDVTRRQVQLTVDVEIINQKTGLAIFTMRGASTKGDYNPGAENDGKKKAVDLLVTNIVTEAHKNW